MWFVVDTCGIVCFLVAYVLLTASDLVVVTSGHWPLCGPLGSNLCLVIYQVLFILSIWSHLACMFSDPGTVPLDSGLDLPIPEGSKQCTKCRSVKPPRAHHCSTCQRCVLKMDHHCPWVNNCVGARNQKFFLLFLLYVQLQCYAAIVCLGVRFMNIPTLNSNSHQRKAFLRRQMAYGNHTAFLEAQAEFRNAERQRSAVEEREAGKIVACILIFFVAVVFGLFTAIMLCDQVSNILSNVGGIDRLQETTVALKPRTWREPFQEVMGRGPSWRWLLPLPLKRQQVKSET